jgi:DNA-binding transcriptional LysR family regulator
MSRPDLNLLITLDVLLVEGSVARAAKRLQLSSSAMSRALARLRKTTGDPLLVRSGSGLVATPRALELRERVSRLVQDGSEVLRPADRLDLEQLVRTFTLRTSDGFVENFGPGLINRVRSMAPGVQLRFVHKLSQDSTGLRDGSADLETGVVGRSTDPYLRSRILFRDSFVGVVRSGHPLTRYEVTPQRYVAESHVAVSHRGRVRGPIDEAFAQTGMERTIVTVVDGFSTALSLARTTDLVASVPERHTGKLREGMYSFPLPVDVPSITVSMLWHPRMDADPAHRWLRGCVREACAVHVEEPVKVVDRGVHLPS